MSLLKVGSHRKHDFQPGWIEKITLDKSEEYAEEVGRVILTVSEGISFDEHFTRMSEEFEGKVMIYKVRPGLILEYLCKVLRFENIDKMDIFPLGGEEENLEMILMLYEIMEHIFNLPKEELWVNFESCSGFDQGTFGDDRRLDTLYYQLIWSVVKDWGGLCLFSGHSTGVLINSWRDSPLMLDCLGPCPFAKLNSCSGQMTLCFNPSKLAKTSLPLLTALGNKRKNKKKIAQVNIQSNGDAPLFTFSKSGQTVAKSSNNAKQTRNYFEKALRKGTITAAERLVFDKMVRDQVGKPYEISVLSLLNFFHSPEITSKTLEGVSTDNNARLCLLQDEVGLAGHVLLTYPPSQQYFRVEKFKGSKKPCGRILATCAQWTEMQSVLQRNT